MVQEEDTALQPSASDVLHNADVQPNRTQTCATQIILTHAIYHVTIKDGNGDLSLILPLALSYKIGTSCKAADTFAKTGVDIPQKLLLSPKRSMVRVIVFPIPRQKV